jgi:hypothetical protein
VTSELPQVGGSLSIPCGKFPWNGSSWLHRHHAKVFMRWLLAKSCHQHF